MALGGSEMGRWDENQHPRDGRGRFAEKSDRWANKLSDRLRWGSSRYNRIEGRDKSTEVFDRAPELQTMYRDDESNGDAVLEEICRMQGFDGLPAVGTEAELDDAIAEGGVELWRGVAGNLPTFWGYGPDKGKPAPFNPERSPMYYIEQWRSGPLRHGNGIYGQGTYASVGREAAEAYGTPIIDRDGIATDRADSRSIVRMVLSPDARVINHDDPLFAEYQSALRHLDLQPFIDLERQQTLEYMEREGLGVEDFDPDVPQESKANRYQAISVLADQGRAAAAMGYDAIRVKEGESDGSGLDLEQIVILNRTAVLVQEAHEENLLPSSMIWTGEVSRGVA